MFTIYTCSFVVDKVDHVGLLQVPELGIQPVSRELFLDSIHELLKSATVFPTACNRSCVAKMLSRGDNPPLVTHFGAIPRVQSRFHFSFFFFFNF